MKKYKIKPLSPVKPSKEDLSFTECRSPGCEFQAVYKNPEGKVGIITVNIPGKLKPEWEQRINSSFQKEITIPLEFSRDFIYADISIMDDSSLQK